MNDSYRETSQANYIGGQWGAGGGGTQFCLQVARHEITASLVNELER
ncbi:MAG: hypothetical protein AB4050_04095 [Synechococcus sp.]